MAFTTEEIYESFFEEIEEKNKYIDRWKIKDNDYPHSDYDYSTDDPNNIDYIQDINNY